MGAMIYSQYLTGQSMGILTVSSGSDVFFAIGIITALITAQPFSSPSLGFHKLPPPLFLGTLPILLIFTEVVGTVGIIHLFRVKSGEKRLLILSL